MPLGTTLINSERWQMTGIFLMKAGKDNPKNENFADFEKIMTDMLFAILFVQPKKREKIFDADIVIWMDTIKEGRFEDTNKIFISPEQIDFHITEWNDHNHSDIAEEILKDV